ncbi:MAG: 5,10-methylenetetrahydrofolate dehydrogenase [Firmicutes bacterium]|nr:5,10-methylenetetrahydrofolate dehydrogenase [Bacillota bacterium]
MILLEGKSPAAALRADLSARVAALAATARPPRLAAVLAGSDQASDLYMKRKARVGRELGIAVEEHRLPVATAAELAGLLRRLSLRSDVDGILLEQPLPCGIAKEQVLHAIDPGKDVDGTTGQTHGLLTGAPVCLAPATPLAVMRLLSHYAIPLKGAHVVIVGHSAVVGKPLALMMLAADATVTVCHKETRDLAAHTRHADVLVVAAGVPGLIRGDMIRPGAAVVDVGINLVAGRTVGDVDFESVAAVAGALTPVPGGVGPLTTLTILANTVAGAERRLLAADAGAGAAD